MEENPILEVRDPRFLRLVNPHARLDRLYDGCRWAEGPVYAPAWRCLVWSDIPNDRMLRWDEASGTVAAFRQPSGFANGNALDRQGRLLTCEHGGRRVVRTEPDGSLTVVAQSWRGRRLNSPNDVAVGPDGSIWFTDPTYGIDGWYEGSRAEGEVGGSRLYRVDPRIGAVEAAADDFVQPNGLAFSPDGRRLYVADTGGTHRPDGPRHIRAFEVSQDGGLTGGEVLAECDIGFFDGLRVDEDGRIWTSAGRGVRCYEPDGTLLGAVRLPEVAANLAFGGARRNLLLICATTSLYLIALNVRGMGV